MTRRRVRLYAFGEIDGFTLFSADYNDVKENYLALAYYMDALEIFKMSQEVRWIWSRSMLRLCTPNFVPCSHRNRCHCSMSTSIRM